MFGVNTCLDNLWTVKNSNITVLAVKPISFPKILSEIAPAVGPNNVIVSVAAGVTIDSIQNVRTQDWLRGWSMIPLPAVQYSVS